MKIAIVGAAGRMGKMLTTLAEADKDLEVVAKIDVAEGYDKEWPVDTEGVIDFSFHAAAPGLAQRAARAGQASRLKSSTWWTPPQRRFPWCRAETIRLA